MRIAGIDPGKNGAACLLYEAGRSNWPVCHCVDIPNTDEGEIDGRAYRDLIRDWKPDLLYFENVHAFVGQGVVAAGVFMRNVGILEGISVCEVDRCVRVTPKKWKTRFNLLHTTKIDSRNLAMALFPKSADLFKRVKDHNRADACLIAAYGADRADMIELPRY